MKELKLTFRQKVLLRLLKHDGPFRKRTIPFDEKEWKYVNSLVSGNCLWFGGKTTRKDPKLRAKVHQRELGMDTQLILIQHTDKTHRVYLANKENIKTYLLRTMAKKINFSDLPDTITKIEQEYNVTLRNKGTEA